VSRKGGTERGRLVHPKDDNSMTVSGFGCKKSLSRFISLTLSANGPRKQLGPP